MSVESTSTGVPATEDERDEPVVPLWTALLVLGSAAGGAVLAAAVLPSLFPALAASIVGPEAKAYWFLARSSAFVAFALLWLSMALGLLMTNKLSRLWPGAPATYELHQFASLLGLAFALFHGMILLGDRYIGYTLRDVLVPFASRGYRPVWVGLGQVTFYVSLVVGLSFYVRRRIGHRAWRLLHFASFAAFAGALAHGVFAGTDGASALARFAYWAAGISVVFLTYYRITRSMLEARATRAGKGAPAARLASSIATA
jgi:predicted ferric reductase